MKTKIRNRLRGVIAAALFATGATNAAEDFTISGTTGDCHNSTSYAALFADGCRFENFRNWSRFGAVSTIPASQQAAPLPEDIQRIEFSHDFMGNKLRLSEFLEATTATGFLIIRDGVVIDERYYHGNRPSAPHAGFSMTKSIVSTLVGAAVDDGSIGSVDDLVTAYLPELTSATFEGVTIRQVLQMSSGVKFNEDYSDPESGINKMSHLVQTMPYVNYINTLERSHAPGTYNAYASINTHILGLVVASATGKSLSAYLSEKFWDPMGMQYPAEWMVDKQGKELPMGGLTISLRDWGRFGLLCAQQGRWQDRQLLSPEWVSEATVPSEAHLQPGKNENSDHEFGYQYQWWIPQQPMNDFMALGIWGQTLYVNPALGVVIVKQSADPGSFQEGTTEAQIEYFQALATALAK